MGFRVFYLFVYRFSQCFCCYFSVFIVLKHPKPTKITTPYLSNLILAFFFLVFCLFVYGFLGFRVEGLGFRVEGLGFGARVYLDVHAYYICIHMYFSTHKHMQIDIYIYMCMYIIRKYHIT